MHQVWYHMRRWHGAISQCPGRRQVADCGKSRYIPSESEKRARALENSRKCLNFKRFGRTKILLGVSDSFSGTASNELSRLLDASQIIVSGRPGRFVYFATLIVLIDGGTGERSSKLTKTKENSRYSVSQGTSDRQKLRCVFSRSIAVKVSMVYNILPVLIFLPGIYWYLVVLLTRSNTRGAGKKKESTYVR